MILILKIVVSAILITLLLWQVDWQSFGQLIRDLDPVLTTLAVVLLTLQFPLSAWKWQKSLQAHELDFGFGYLLSGICVGFFFNNFLPTSIGGDAYRAYRTMEPGRGKLRPISAVVLERLLGILALLAIGAVCAVLLIVRGGLLHSELISWVLGVGVVIVVVALAARYTKPMKRVGERLARSGKLQPLMQNLRVLAAHPRQLIETATLSFLFQMIAIAVIVALFAAQGLDWRVFESGFVAAAAGVAGVLPISINGIGVMEGSFALASVEARLPFDEAVFVALFLRLFMLAASVVCGAVYAFEPQRVSGAAGNAE